MFVIKELGIYEHWEYDELAVLQRLYRVLGNRPLYNALSKRHNDFHL